MCGILFEYNFDLSTEDFSHSLLSIKHRGPDFTGFFNKKKIKIGHQRLSIIDLNERSNQPLFDSSNRYIIVYNGEVFNFKDLKTKYKIKVSTQSDTEVVLNLFIKIGPSFINELNGMFAICIYDTKTQNVFIGRDRYGIKPLFYIVNKNGFFLSSEIKPLKKYIKSNEFDSFSVRQYKKMRGLKPGRTLYKEIKEFLPAHYSYGKEIIQKRFWSPEFNNDLKFNLDEFSDIFIKSINDCTISDVSYDCMLSGGIDSSLIASLTKPKTCWVIGRDDFNEFNYATDVANMFNLDLNKVIFNPNIFMNELDNELNNRSYPVTVPNEILINYLSKFIKKSSKVLLCGEGADEVFLGYDRIFRHFFNKKINIEDFDKFYCYGSENDYEVIEDAAGHIFGKDFSSLRKFFIEFHLLGLLKRVDFNTMRHSIESRVPFLHNDIFDYVSRIDPKLNLNQNDSKIILKDFSLKKEFIAG